MENGFHIKIGEMNLHDVEISSMMFPGLLKGTGGAEKLGNHALIPDHNADTNHEVDISRNSLPDGSLNQQTNHEVATMLQMVSDHREADLTDTSNPATVPKINNPSRSDNSSNTRQGQSPLQGPSPETPTQPDAGHLLEEYHARNRFALQPTIYDCLETGDCLYSEIVQFFETTYNTTFNQSKKNQLSTTLSNMKKAGKIDMVNTERGNVYRLKQANEPEPKVLPETETNLESNE